MNNKGFSLIELLGCLMLLGIILGIGLYSAKGTLATSLSTIDQVSENEIYDAAEVYVLEYSASWINVGDEYTCLTVEDLVDAGYFDYSEVKLDVYKKIKIIRDSNTRVINSVKFVDNCE